MKRSILCLAVVLLLTPTVSASVSQNAGKLLITEVAMKESNDWIELYVVDGSVDWSGYRIYRNASSYYALPTNSYQMGQYIVLHEESGTDGLIGNCWHFYSALGAGLTGTDQNIFITDPEKASTYVDALIYSNNSGKYTASVNEANDIVADAMWNAYDFSAGDAGAWTDTDDISSGQSLGRYLNETHDSYIDNNSKNDWYRATSQSMGAENDNSLPIFLTSFQAVPQVNRVRLTWTTQSEVNNLGFNVYRSLYSDKNFAKISRLIKGAGNSTVRHRYHFVDQDVRPERTYYYQLEDVDFAGQRQKHAVISVTVHDSAGKNAIVPDEIQLSPGYPNPFGPGIGKREIAFQMAVPQNKSRSLNPVSLGIYNCLGQRIRNFVISPEYAGILSVVWNGMDESSRLVPAGIYYTKLSGTETPAIRKILFVK